MTLQIGKPNCFLSKNTSLQERVWFPNYNVTYPYHPCHLSHYLQNEDFEGYLVTSDVSLNFLFRHYQCIVQLPNSLQQMGVYDTHEIVNVKKSL